MKVCNINYSDYSNLGHRMAEAITQQGVQCDNYVLKPHAFGYRGERLVRREDLKEITSRYDVVQIMHSQYELLHDVDLSRKITVWHTGTPYRRQPEIMNSIFNPVVKKSFYDSCEFEKLGMKNPVYALGCIDVSKFNFQYTKGRNFIFGHFPSNHLNKGTEQINEVMNELNGITYHHNIHTTSYKSNLSRIMNCDIYIEMMQPIQNGKQYGSFGLTALEAAAMGKVVITNLSNYKIYQETYGNPCLVIVEDKEQLKSQLLSLNELSTSHLRALQLETFAWVKKYHDYEPSGKRLIKELSEL